MPVTIDQRDLKRRHPLCPSCGYDLVATLAANTRVCPECGEAFELDELAYELRAGDWSNTVALRRAALALGWRTLAATAVAIGLSALAIELLNLQLPRVGPFLVALVQACAVGALCSRRLIDEAGFHSVLLIIGACIAVVIATSLGFLAASDWIIAPRFAGMAFGHVSVSLIAAFVWVIHHLLMDQ